MKKESTNVMRGVISALGAVGSMGYAERYSLDRGSDLSELRGDWDMVGQDFRTVIQREHGKTISQKVQSTGNRKSTSASR
jgi:hypothetical protein